MGVVFCKFCDQKGFSAAIYCFYKSSKPLPVANEWQTQREGVLTICALIVNAMGRGFQKKFLLEIFEILYHVLKFCEIFVILYPVFKFCKIFEILYPLLKVGAIFEIWYPILKCGEIFEILYPVLKFGEIFENLYQVL